MLRQAIDRIDHVAIVVFRESVDRYVAKLTSLFGIEFCAPSVNDELACITAISWDSGLEILAPTLPEGPLWDRLQKFGEGSIILVFGVKDIDAAMRRAEDDGTKVQFQVQLTGGEPWLERFGVFREAGLEDVLGTTFVLSQIEPKETAE